MALVDDAQHHSPLILDALLYRDIFKEDLDANDSEYEINDNDSSGRKITRSSTRPFFSAPRRTRSSAFASARLVHGWRRMVPKHST